jgi:hypothetical protein
MARPGLKYSVLKMLYIRHSPQWPSLQIIIDLPVRKFDYATRIREAEEIIRH